MADYSKEMRALEGLMAEEDAKKASNVEERYPDQALTRTLSPLIGTGEGAKRAYRDEGLKRTEMGRLDTERRKGLMDKYKMYGGLQGKQMDRVNSMADRKALIDYKATKDAQTSAAKVKAPKKLSAANVLKVNEGNAIPKTLDTIAETIETNKDLFGPIEGRIRSLNPYDTKGQVLDAEIRAASQQFGRYMEGGVLRKEDEIKYRKMFPAMSDTREIADGKLDIVRKLLRRKQESDLDALGKQNYDLTGLALPEQAETPRTPEAPSVAGNALKTVSDAIVPGAEASEAKVKVMYQGKMLMIPQARVNEAVADGAEVIQ